MFCSQCGTQLPDTAKFCSACGASVQSGAAPAAKQKSSPALKLAAAGSIVAVLAAAGYAMFAPAPVVTKPALVAPKPAPEIAAPEPKAPEKAPEPSPAPVAQPQAAPAPDAADIAAAHKALDQKIADEEAAAKKRSGKN